MKIITLLAALLASVAVFAGAASAAKAGLHIIGTGRAAGQFAVTAANGHQDNAKALYMRGYGPGLSGYAVVACSRGFSVGSKSARFGSMQSGRLYRLKLPMSGDCDVTASLSGRGPIRLQILAS
jgi:hypothetical protein